MAGFVEYFSKHSAKKTVTIAAAGGGNPHPLAGCAVMWALTLSCITAGCYNPHDLEAFLQEHQRPVAGLEYRLYPPDVITITSLHVPEINNIIQQVTPDGKINVPLIGEIYIAGKTVEQVEEAIAKGARDFYERVDVTVRVTGYNSQNFYVFGQVAMAGPNPWTGNDTLLDALARARPTNLAWMERVTVIRGNDPKEGGYYNPGMSAKAKMRYRSLGKYPKTKSRPRKKMVFNLNAMVQSGDMSNNILLMPNDVIYVQPCPLATVGLAIQRVLFPINPVIDAASAPSRVVTGAAIP